MGTILIADDHAIVRQGIKMLIENHDRNFNFVEAASCAEVQKIMSDRSIDYAILDLSFSDGNLFSDIEQITEYARKTKILIYSMNPEKIYARRFIGKGAKGFISKQANIKDLENAIQTILRGEIYLSAYMKDSLFSTVKSDALENPLDLLSNRELQIVEYMVLGMGTKEIAGKMNLDITTISTYRRRAFDKLDVQNVIELKEKLSIYKNKL